MSILLIVLISHLFFVLNGKTKSIIPNKINQKLENQIDYSNLKPHSSKFNEINKFKENFYRNTLEDIKKQIQTSELEKKRLKCKHESEVNKLEKQKMAEYKTASLIRKIRHQHLNQVLLIKFLILLLLKIHLC